MYITDNVPKTDLESELAGKVGDGGGLSGGIRNETHSKAPVRS